MSARAALAAVLAGLLAAPALAAAPPAKDKEKAPAAKAPAKAAGTKAAPAKAKPADEAAAAAKPTGDDADFASAGKVIEFDGSGKAKVVKGQASADPDLPPGAIAGEDLPGAQDEKTGAGAAPPSTTPAKPAGDLSAADGCKIRFKAQCAFLAHCAGNALPLDCDQMLVVCDNLEGPAPYTRKDAEACAAGIKTLSCATMQAMGLAFDPEAKVPACKPVREAEQGGSEPPAKPQGTNKAGKTPQQLVPGAGQDFRDVDVDVGGVLGGGTE